MIETSCHCGAVHIAVETDLTEVTDCNCSICRRYGALWFYASPGQVTVTGATDIYEWDKHAIKLHRCARCGCVTHWSANDPARDKVGLNARLADPALLAEASVRRFDGADTGKYLD